MSDLSDKPVDQLLPQPMDQHPVDPPQKWTLYLQENAKK